MIILIKNIEMPKNCYECFCHEQVKAGIDHPTFDYCVLENWKQSRTPLTMTPAEAMEGIADFCSLIELPPHGRLIDVNTAIILLQDYYNREKDTLKQHAIGECIMIIKDDVPTVIEAEEGK